ncbi:MAG: hypothetical protein C0614_09200 [Desulfuromonas sp.]|nr:MAG: hypothetical protein C0614_09200 [Desulfuromonas sp.]
MSIYRVEKTEQPVTLFYSDGSVISGVVFLSPSAYTHIGRQTLVDLLKEKGEFFPFRSGNDRFYVINKRSITHIRYQPAVKEKGADVLGTPVEINIEFIGGEQLAGQILIEMPEGRTRLFDFINEIKGYFVLTTEEAHYLVNASLIRDVSPA